jgi:hypothetical protein
VYIHVHYSIYVIISLYLKAISCTSMRTCASMHAFPYLCMTCELICVVVLYMLFAELLYFLFAGRLMLWRTVRFKAKSAIMGSASFHMGHFSCISSNQSRSAYRLDLYMKIVCNAFFRFCIPNQIAILFLNSLFYQLICNIAHPALFVQTPNRFDLLPARSCALLLASLV